MAGEWSACSRSSVQHEFLVRPPRATNTSISAASGRSFCSSGLFVWLFLMARALWPALRTPGDKSSSAGSVPHRLGGDRAVLRRGLDVGSAQRNLAIAEYWRWWVVHLWVEGFFEVFATVVIAFLFARHGSAESGVGHARGVVLDRDLSLRRNHRNVSPPVFHRHAQRRHRAGRNVQRARSRAAGARLVSRRTKICTLEPHKPWVAAYKWPIYFFVAVAFWNLVGAGLFGFLINPPIALYYMQGLNTTAVHGHTALFGVYGMLGIGLMLFCLRGLDAAESLEERAAERSPSGPSTSAWR